MELNFDGRPQRRKPKIGTIEEKSPFFGMSKMADCIGVNKIMEKKEVHKLIKH